MATNEAVIHVIRQGEDGKGFVIAGELKDRFQSLNFDYHHIGKYVIKKLNEFIEMESNDADTKIKVEEAIILFELDKEPKNLAKEMFKECDVNEDGYISKEERVKYLKMIKCEDEGQRMIDYLMRNSDDDKDGKLNYDEFCKMMDETLAEYFGFG